MSVDLQHCCWLKRIMTLIRNSHFFRKRDEAHRKVKEMFAEVIAKRKSGEPEDDMLQTLIDSTYK